MNAGILSAIGNTPLIRLSRVLEDVDFQIYGKLESLNPGGSVKDRSAYSIISHGVEAGLIRSSTVVIESSSGNMGIGLAQACAYFGLRFICVIDPKTTLQNVRILEAYGADIDLVSEPDEATGEYLQARINRVQTLLREIKDSYWSDQYSNLHNSLAHHQTMREMVTALRGRVEYLFCAASTCGTLRGCAEYIRNHNLKTRLIAVDAVGSVIFGGRKMKRLIPGHGAAVRPGLYRPDLSDGSVYVSDLDCVVGCRRLVQLEAILAGGSSGGVLMAIERKKREIPRGANCVAIFPDRGERYLDTIYSDAWVKEHFGDVFGLWQAPERRQTCAQAI